MATTVATSAAAAAAVAGQTLASTPVSTAAQGTVPCIYTPDHSSPDVLVGAWGRSTRAPVWIKFSSSLW